MTYFQNYQFPRSVSFDEAYHLTSAQRYLNGVFFMHCHPPLGKLFIALGESLVGANDNNDQFIGTTKVNEQLPDNFSFRGYRLFPALFGWGSAMLIFYCFLQITGRHTLSALLSAGYLFDNALIVHSRLALLEPSQMFFILLTVLIFLLLFKKQPQSHFIFYSLAFGAAFSAVVNTKLNGAILVLLVPALFVSWSFKPRKVTAFVLLSATTFLFTSVLIWQAHFALGRKVVNTLDNEGYFKASEEYKQILAEGSQWSPKSFPVMLRDSLRYITQYHEGVPTLNLCKDGEIGSPTLFWPLGGRSIIYRWEMAGQDTARYLYLQSNPVIWLTGLAAVLISFALLCVRFLIPGSIRLKNTPLLSVFLSSYIGYLLVMSSLHRVTYLFHYFIPLIFSLMLLALLAVELQQIFGIILTAARKTFAAAVWTAATLSAFWAYKPLTYYDPITSTQLKRLALFSIWDLRCHDCGRTSRIANPGAVKDSAKRQLDRIRLNGLPVYKGYLEEGRPGFKIDRTPENRPLVVGGVHYDHGIGAHSNSSLKFRLDGKYARFKALTGLPDYLQESQGSVVFQVLGDGRLLWESDLVRSHQPPRQIDISVADVKVLELRVDDGGDDPNYDHACWLVPQLD